jgi:hypothetical protein
MWKRNSVPRFSFFPSSCLLAIVSLHLGFEEAIHGRIRLTRSEAELNLLGVEILSEEGYGESGSCDL